MLGGGLEGVQKEVTERNHKEHCLLAFTGHTRIKSEDKWAGRQALHLLDGRPWWPPRKCASTRSLVLYNSRSHLLLQLKLVALRGIQIE